MPMEAPARERDARRIDAPTLLVVGGGGLLGALEEAFGDVHLHAVSTAAEALAAAATERVEVLCLGPETAGAAARDLLVALEEGGGDRSTHRSARRHLVFAAGPELEIFQSLVDADRIYYLSQAPPPEADAIAIVRSALDDAARPDLDDEIALDLHRALELTDAVDSARDLADAAARAADAVAEWLDADRAEVLLYDPQEEVLWSRAPGRAERRESTAAGLVSFVLRTRSIVRLERVGEDPRYDPDADNDGGSPSDRFLAAPIRHPNKDRRVWAVAVALRGLDAPPWSERDERRLLLLGEQLEPLLGRRALRAELDERSKALGLAGGETGEIFRREAVEHHLRGLEAEGHPLQISPSWTDWVYRLLLAACLAAILFSILAPIHEYAAGPAVVRSAGRIDVTAVAAGTVEEVMAPIGRSVRAGDLLVRLDAGTARAELEETRKNYESALRDRLRDPSDAAAASAVAQLRNALERLENQLETRRVRAPHDGVVRDIWTRVGHHLTPGQGVVSLERPNPELRVVALIPGQYRPQLEPGMTLRLELEGYRYAYQTARIDAVGDAVVGPSEAARVLGPALADAVLIEGPVVFVEAHLDALTFESGGERFTYHDGVVGRAEIRVRSEPILLTLVPGLKALVE